MILGHKEHYYSACFDEYDKAISELTKKIVCLNAHRYPAPKGSIIYNLENIPPANPKMFEGHEVWDFSKKNVDKYGYKYVPVGYHKSMKRFKLTKKKKYDVAFFGGLSDFRRSILENMRQQGLKIFIGETIFGDWRNSIMAESKMILSTILYPNGVFPPLRAAHCLSNKVPLLCERCPEDESWQGSGIFFCERAQLVQEAKRLTREKDELKEGAKRAYKWFKNRPLILPI